MGNVLTSSFLNYSKRWKLKLAKEPYFDVLIVVLRQICEVVQIGLDFVLVQDLTGELVDLQIVATRDKVQFGLLLH